MEMGAIIQIYSSAAASVKCIQAGADVVLSPLNYKSAFDAVNSGSITESRINDSIRRILLMKRKLHKI